MNFATWSIRNPVPPIALFLVLLIVGLVSFRSLPVTHFPNIDLPIVSVTIAQPGAAPSELVGQVAQPVEDAIYGVAGVRHVHTTTSDSLAAITVEFELATDSDRALNDVKDAVASVRSDLPESISEPVIKRLDVTGMPILNYAVRDPSRSIEELSRLVDDVIARELQTIAQVGKVSRIGGAAREIKVELDPDRLLAHGLTAAEVSQQLRGRNIDLGGGRGDLAGSEYSIRALGAAPSVAALAATPIAIAGGRTIPLDSLGSVRDGGAEARSFALLDGTPVVAFSVQRASGASDLSAATGARERLAQLSERYPGLEISLIDDMTVFTRANFDKAMETLYEGAALAVIVVFLFLRNWRATLIAAVALPLSIIPTFFVIHQLGFTLNMISLLGITLVTGILVDDAIVEIENIVRHIQMGKSAYDASEHAATEIGLTVIAISFSIVAVFAPVSFMGGIAGQYFKQFGLTVAISVLFSLLVARIVTPMMAAYLLRNADTLHEPEDGWLLTRLMRLLGWTLRHRLLTLLAGLAIFAGSIYSATLLPTEFAPPADMGKSVLEIELPPGATLAENAAMSRQLSARIQALPFVKQVFVEGGSGDVTKSRLIVDYGPAHDRDDTSFELQRRLQDQLADVPDLRVTFRREDGQSDVTISVLGDTEAAATAAAEGLVRAMSGLPQLEGVTSAAALRRPEIRITPKPEIAAQLGISASTLAQTLRVATLGDSEANLAKFSSGDQQIPIMVRLSDEARADLRQVQNLRLPSTAGPVPLAAVADIGFAVGPAQISRYDRRFKTEVTANLAPGALLGPAMTAIMALPEAGPAMPPGTQIQSAGDAEVMAEVFGAFGTAMGAGILLVYVVLVLLFASFVTPITILLSLPLAIGGAILGLFVTGHSISLAVVIGFLMLMGIVTKNAIMLVEFAKSAMDRGTPKTAAILDAVHKRARPIVMTTIAMTAGMIPSALGTGEGGNFRAPMAIAVIGGLVLSTLLSLVFVPSLFSVIDGAEQRLRRLFGRVLGTGRRRA
ncbi:efflux RND transporter permease subunit [Paracoccus sp. p4-l81]|uniref:efflux RND transporter permease subunit n=1 Tax=unclassified Paracoccus (in: a-proteobacteria) TaxID=2688777 RepID=UPI0035B8FB9B